MQNAKMGFSNSFIKLHITCHNKVKIDFHLLRNSSCKGFFSKMVMNMIVEYKGRFIDKLQILLIHVTCCNSR